MKVHVTDHNTDTEKLYEGTPEHVQQLLFFHYPWLRSNAQEDRGDLIDTLENLDTSSYFQVHYDADSAELDHLYQKGMSDDELIEDGMDDE